MATYLSREHCQACTPGTAPLATGDAESLLRDLDVGWSIDDSTTLRRRFLHRDFATAFALATRIAMVAESQAHHPDLRVGWGYLDVDLTTHAAGGLTRNDFIVAAKIDKIIGAGMGFKGH